jgi:ABC-type branched-subunit amino acid transport system substrate-binding protein
MSGSARALALALAAGACGGTVEPLPAIDRRPEPAPDLEVRARLGVVAGDDAERAASLRAGVDAAVARANRAGGLGGVPVATVDGADGVHAIIELGGDAPVVRAGAARLVVDIDAAVAARVAQRVAGGRRVEVFGGGAEALTTEQLAALDGVRLVVGFHLDDPAAAALVALYRADRDESPGLAAALAHDAAMLAIDAIGRGGRLEVAAVEAALAAPRPLPLATGTALAGSMPVAEVRGKAAVFVERVAVE